MYDKLNSIKGFSCNEIEGALYGYPNITFPESFIEEAKKNSMAPDYYYCKVLLEKTGVLTVPGGGFGQKPGTYHLRLTNLVNPVEKLLETLERVHEFNMEVL